MVLSRGFYSAERIVTLRCPLCEFDVESSELQLLPGSGGGLKCPRCAQILMFRQSRRFLRWAISIVISAGLIWVSGIKSSLLFVGSTLLLSIPISLFVNAYFIHLVPPTLVPWKPRRHRKSVIELVNDSNATIELLSKNRK